MNLKRTLPFFSYLFHPIFIPVYAALFYFFWSDSNFTNSDKHSALLQIVFITIVLPILFFFLLRSRGLVDSIMISDASQRKIPLLILCFLIIFLVRKSITIDQFPGLHFYFLGGLMSSLLVLIMLFFKTKASLHMVGISSLTVFVLGLCIGSENQCISAIFFLVLLNGLVACSRVEMKAHTLKELVIGLFFGIIPQLLLFRFWL